MCTSDCLDDKAVFCARVVAREQIFYRSRDDGSVRVIDAHYYHRLTGLDVRKLVSSDADSNANTSIAAAITADAVNENLISAGFPGFECHEAFGCVFVWHGVPLSMNYGGSSNDAIEIDDVHEHGNPPTFGCTEEFRSLLDGCRYVGCAVDERAALPADFIANKADMARFCLLSDRSKATRERWWDSFSGSVGGIDFTRAHGKATSHVNFLGVMDFHTSVSWENRSLGVTLLKSEGVFGIGDAYFLDFITPIDYILLQRTTMMFVSARTPWFIGRLFFYWFSASY